MAKKRSAHKSKSATPVTGFGSFVRARRAALGLSLREFCRRNGLDKGNLSRLERGLLAPPQDAEVLTSYAKALQFADDSPDWTRLFELAVAETGRLPDRTRARGDRTTRSRIREAVRANVGEGRAAQVWTTEKDLEQWSDRNDAIACLPQLLRLLVRATLDRPKLVRFSAGEGVRRHGWDGIIETAEGNDFVPEGISGWELSVEKSPQSKASRDFEQRTKEAARSDVSRMTFVFVTPRKWDNKSKSRWCEEKRSLGIWKDVVALDSTDLEQWLEIAKGVDLWIARRIGLRPDGVTDLEEHWNNLRETTNPPLSPDVFTASRDDVVKHLRGFLGLSSDANADPEAVPEPLSRPRTLAFEAASPTDVLDFLAAALQRFDSDERDHIESRLVIVEQIEAWRDLCQARHPLVLVTHPRLSVDPEAIAEAARRGHQVLLCSERFVGDRSRVVELPAPRRDVLEKAILHSGVAEEQARRVVDDSGRSLSVVKRQLARFSHSLVPPWAERTPALDLLPILLAGGWDDESAADQALMVRLAGRPYHEVLSTANHWLRERDPPVMRIQSTWSLVSRADSWHLLAPSLTSKLLDRYAEVAVEVLGTDDPALTLPIEERWCAALHGKQPQFSRDLRKGLAETLVLLAAKSPDKVVPEALHPAARASIIVRQLLENASWTRWASLSDVLPLLAEAAPDPFLSALERDLQRPEPAALKLFEQSARGSAMFGRCYHAGLLWALEVLAWSAHDVSRAALALACLAERKPHTGHWGNSPFRSLIEVFLPWLPQTVADAPERMRILKTLLKRMPDTGWRLLLDLLPDKHTASDFIHRPRWRNWIDGYEADVTGSELWEQSQQIGRLILDSVGSDAARIEQAIQELAHFPGELRDKLIKKLEVLELVSFDEEPRDRIATVLREMSTSHRRLATASWALPADLLDRLDKVRARFEPASPMQRNAWLFQSDVQLPIRWDELTYADQQQRVRALQRSAIHEVFNVDGLSSVHELVELAELPRLVGFILAGEKLVTDTDVLPQCLSSENPKLVDFGKGFFHGRRSSDGWSWVEQLPFERWSVREAGCLLAELPFERCTRDLIDRLPDEVENWYWQHTDAFCTDPAPEEVTFTVENLLRRRRPMQALHVLNIAVHEKCAVDPGLVIAALEAARTGDAAEELQNRNPAHLRCWIPELIAYLQGVDGVDRRRLASIELSYLSVLDRYLAQANTLFSLLRDEPGLYVDAIRCVFRSETADQDASQASSENRERAARTGHILLRGWEKSKPPRLPGSNPDGKVDADRLVAWVDKARELCRDSGHLGVCDSQLGSVLANDPEPDTPDAGWPCEPVRDLLEEINSESLFRGFEIGIRNKRGVTGWSPTDGGEQERVLAGKYRAYAAACQNEWPLVASSLRRVADGYDREAARQDEEARRWL